MAQQASDEVQINVGVPGRVLRGPVSLGTTIGEALTKFGFNFAEQFGYDLRAWSRGASRPLVKQYSDPVEADMTILALRPIIGPAPDREMIADIVTRILGKDGVKDIWVQSVEDRDGEESLRITLVLDVETAERLNGRITTELLRETRRRLQSIGEMRFPVFKYITLPDFERSAEMSLAAE